MIGLERLRSLQQSYLVGHYLNLHAMIVSIAIGLGLVSAGTVLPGWLDRGTSRHPSLYTIMLAASFLMVLVVYAGPLHGAIFLPAGIPAVVDLFLPLVVGLAEFAMFGILAASDADWATPKTIVASWWAAIALLGLCGAGQIVRAHRLIGRAAYEPDAQPLRDQYLKRLVGQAIGASANGVAGVALATWALYRYDQDGNTVHIIASAGVLAFGLLALAGHRSTARMIRRGLN